jgi:hypothetical protein
LPAALLQHVCAVDERGRVHGAPGLAVVVAHRVQAWRRGPCRKRERKRGWVRSDRRHDRLRGQDNGRVPVFLGLQRAAPIMRSSVLSEMRSSRAASLRVRNRLPDLRCRAMGAQEQPPAQSCPRRTLQHGSS